ncbi:hypothetical protein L7F22_064988 [Adiantum nelumboides]|nr:hypothetical protein [Adiantum nelumboides]
MDYHTLPRRQLQSLCKKHGIPANATNIEMANALSTLLTPKPDNTKEALKVANWSQEPAALTTDSKVKNIQFSEVQVHKISDGDEKCSVKPQRGTRLRGCLTEAPTTAPLKTENVKNGGIEITSGVQKQQTKSVSTRRRVRNQDEDGVQSKPADINRTKVESPNSEKKKERAGGIVLRRGRVKVRSPRSLFKTTESDKSLNSLEANAKSNEATKRESAMLHRQSRLLDSQKIPLRKNKRLVTFSDVLAVTHSFSESPCAEVLTDSTTSLKGLAADQENQSLVSICEDKKAEGSRNGSRRASRRDCIQGNPTIQPTQQKSRKVECTDLNILSSSEQSNGNPMIEAGKDNCSESCSRRRSISGRKAGVEAALVWNEKQRVDGNQILCEEVLPVSHTRQSRRLTPRSLDVNNAQDKKMSSRVNEEEVVDSFVQGNLDIESVTNTRRSRRLTILASEMDNQAKAKINETLQDKSNDGHEGSNLIVPTKKAGCEPHVEASRRGRRRTLAPLELNQTQIHLQKGEEPIKTITPVVKNTNNEEHALDLVTGSHNAPPKHSKVKLSARVSLAIHPTKPNEKTTEKVRRSRQKNPVGSVLSSFGKEKTSNFEEVSDKDRRVVCRRDAHVTARETRPGAGPAKNELNCCETEVLDKSLGIAAIPDLTYETNDILSGSNGPEEGGIQVCTSIPEDLIDLKKGAANPSEEFEISSKACSDNSSKNLGKVNGNVKELDPINLHSTNDISSAKSCDTLFPTTGSAEGPSIAPRDAPLCENFRADEAEISSVAVIQNVSCYSNADNSTFGNDVVSVCLELTKEDGLLFESASNCAHQVLEDCSWENSAPSKSRPISNCAASEPMSDSIGGILPDLAKMMLVRMISDVGGVIDNNVAMGRTSPVSKEMGPAYDNLGEIQFTIDNEICPINTGIAKSDLKSRPSSSIDTSLGEVNDQGKLYIRVNEVKNNFCFEENIAPQELPAESQFIAEEGNEHTSKSSGNTALTSARMASDKKIVNKETLGSTSPDLTNTSPTGGNVGESQFTIDIEEFAFETSATRADIDSHSNSSESMTSNEVTEQVDMKDGLSIDPEEVVPQELWVGSVKSPFEQLDAAETCSPKQEACSDMLLLLTSITSDEQAIIDSDKTMESNSYKPRKMISADFNLNEAPMTNEIAEHKIECGFNLSPDTKSSSTSPAKSRSGMDTAPYIGYTTGVNSLDNLADAVVKDVKSCEIKSPSEHHIVAEIGAPGQEMCSDNKLSITCVNECESTEGLEFNSWCDKAVHGEFSLPKEVKSKDKEESNDHIADSLQVLNEGTQFDGVTMVADISCRDNQVGPLPLSSVDVQGNTLPVEVRNMKQRRPRAIYKSARKPKPSGLQETRSFTEMGFGPSGKAGCFMPCDLEEDMNVQHYGTSDMGSEEGDSEIGSFSDREVFKFKPEVLPQNPDEDASWSEDSTWSDSGEDTAFGSEEKCFKDEEEVSSDDETCVSDGDMSEEEPSEGDEDVFSDDSGSLTDHETSPVLHTSAKLKFSKASSCSGHLLEGTGVQAAESDVQQCAADGSSVFYEEPALDQEKICQSLEGESNNTFLGVHSSDSTQLLSNDPNSLKVVDMQLATHNTCQNDILPTSLSCLFATPQSKIQEATNCSCEPSSTDYQLSSEGAFAENEKGQQSVDKVEDRTEFCAPFSALEMDHKENGTVISILGSLELSYTDKPVNNNLYQAVESTVKIDGGSKEAATEDARAKTPDICEGVCTEELGAGKNYPDIFTRTVDDGVATDKQTEAIAVIATEDAGTDTSEDSEEICSQVFNEDFGTGKNYPHTSTRLAEDGIDNNRHAEERFGVEAATTESTTIAVDLELKGQVPQTECSYKERECSSGLADKLLGNVWNERQAAQSQQISQTPHLNAVGKHMRGLVDELLENVLKAMTQQCAIGLKSETEVVHCAETPQVSREDAKGELQSETEAVHAAEVSQSSRAGAKGELNKAEVDETLEKISNENITCATCSTCETDNFEFLDISEAHCVAAEDDLIGSPMEELLGAVLNEAEACDDNQVIKELVGDVSATVILREQSLQHLDLIGAPMEELLGAVPNKAEACDDNQVIKEIVGVDVSATEILREQSLQHFDLTLMSLRKLKHMCKENDFPATTKPVTETPSRREVNAWMSAKKANISVQPKDLPSAYKRSALKALSSNIKSNTPASSARTPMAKNMQRPRNLMSNYGNSEGGGRNLVAPSPQAPSSSRRDFAKSVRQ